MAADMDGGKTGARLVPQQKRSREARARIMAAAELLLREKGVDGFSMAAIGSLADMPIGNIYRRFEGKDDLLQALKDVVAIRIRDAVFGAVGNVGHGDLASYVRAFTGAVAGVFSSDEALHRALFDPRVANRRMLETGLSVRGTIYGLFLDGLKPHLPEVEEDRVAMAAKVAFSIVTGAALLKVRGHDPIMNALSWPEVRSEYSAAAFAYLDGISKSGPEGSCSGIEAAK